MRPVTPRPLFQPTVAFCSAVELNATTDVDFFVSAAQIRLVVGVASRLAGLAATSPRPADGVVATSPAASSADVPPDSGVESDASTLQASVDARDARQTAPPAVFDALLTARRVSVVLYQRCVAAIDPTTSSPARTSDDAAVVLPLVYVEFSQPHAALAGRPAARTVEMSCYDVVLKGVQPHYQFYGKSGDVRLNRPSPVRSHWLIHVPCTSKVRVIEHFSKCWKP